MKGKKFYAVKFGKDINGKLIQDAVFETWDECAKVVRGVKDAKFKSFTCQREALEWLKSMDTNEFNEQIKTRYIKPSSILSKGGVNLQIVNRNTKNYILKNCSSKEEQLKRVIFIMKITKNPFVKEYLYNRQQEMCEFCFNKLDINTAQIHHKDYDGQCYYGKNNTITITYKESNGQIHERYGIPNCEYCFLDNKDKFNECVSKLALIHGRCNAIINDYTRGAKIVIGEKEDKKIVSSKSKIMQLEIPDLARVSFSNEDISRKDIDLFVFGSCNNENSTGYYIVQLVYPLKNYTKLICKNEIDVKSDLEMRLKAIMKGIKSLNMSCNITVHINEFAMNGMVIKNGCCVEDAKVLKMKAGKYRLEIKKMLEEGKHTYLEVRDDGVKKYLSDLAYKEGVDKPHYKTKRRYNNDAL